MKMLFEVFFPLALVIYLYIANWTLCSIVLCYQDRSILHLNSAKSRDWRKTLSLQQPCECNSPSLTAGSINDQEPQPLPSEFYHVWAEVKLPMGCSQPMSEYSKNTKTGLILVHTGLWLKDSPTTLPKFSWNCRAA